MVQAATEVDACLFIADKVICLTYVGDTLFFARDEKDVDDVISKLSEKMTLEVESDAAGFVINTRSRDSQWNWLKSRL